MGDPGNNGADQASIKPVSSLRSLFEKRAGIDASTTTPSSLLTPRTLAQLDRTQDGSPRLTRASLDIPRMPSPWSASDSAGDSQSKGKPGPPIPRPRRPNSRILQRPLSTTSLSGPRSPPLVTVESPKSPPKSSQPTNMQGFPQSLEPSPLVPVNVVPLSPCMVPVPPKRLSRSPEIDMQSDSADARKYGPESTPARNLSDGHSAQISTRNIPATVHRAEKPKVPTKPALISSKAKLEPRVLTTDEGLSPFSTPPSSNEAVEPESPFPKASEARVRNTGLRPPKGDKTHQPTTLHSLHDAAENAATPRIWRLEARNSGFTPALDSNPHASVPEALPGLPPRKGQHQSTERTVVENGNKIMAANVTHCDRSMRLQVKPEPLPQLLPPPKRTSIAMSSNTSHPPKSSLSRRVGHSVGTNIAPGSSVMSEQEPESTSYSSNVADHPDVSNINRCPPSVKIGVEEIDITYDTRLVDICGRYVATTGHMTRVWDTVTGEMVLNVAHGEKEVRVTSLAFKPAATADEEGSALWLGTNYGDIQEVHIPTQRFVYVKTGAHEGREVVKIYRHQSSMWTLCDAGKLCVWLGDETGLPDLRQSPKQHKVSRGHTFSLIVQDDLWLATGKEIRVFRPSAADDAGFSILQEPLSQPGIGAITSGAIIGGQLDRVYFGHADGKVTIYSITEFNCLGVVSVSVYKISCLAGAGFYLWAGYSTGAVCVYDTWTRPWTTKKDWLAHSNPILNILVDRSSLWKDGVLRVVSLGADNALRFWDGTLKDDWLVTDMQDHDVEYCSFRELTALVVSWNAGAATPIHLRYEKRDSRFFNDVLQADMPPDLLVFGFQELVDLEDKTLTAKTFFKGNKKKSPSEQEHMSRQYRSWRDYLVRCIEDTMPSSEPYHLLHTASMVGLFSCVFIKASQRHRIRNLNAAEIKRGMGGLHGNKGALVLRFILDDSSLCLVNCHLAAGQTQTVHRNNDITAILESAVLPPSRNTSMGVDTFVGGGDGSLILDHEICILNGDLNYRIDTMGRDTVVKAVDAKNLVKLLERDQLLVSRRRNPGFRVRAFKECPITFDPTYKYDVGSDKYDTSEKRRAPAWCDRILYRGTGKIKQIEYRRHDLRVSDHRPVIGRFKIRIKTISKEKRAAVWKDSERRFEKAKGKLAHEAKVEYLRDVLGVPPDEAKQLI